MALAAKACALWTMCSHAEGSGFHPEMIPGSASVVIVSVMLQRQSNYVKYR